jgi:hypothetical protein
MGPGRRSIAIAAPLGLEQLDDARGQTPPKCRAGDSGVAKYASTDPAFVPQRSHSNSQALIGADDLITVDGQVAAGVYGHVEVVQRLRCRTAQDVPVRVELAAVTPAEESQGREPSQFARDLLAWNACGVSGGAGH